MRLAFSNIGWPAEDDVTVLAALPSLGFTGLEVAPTRIWSEPLKTPSRDVAAFRRRVEDAGLEIMAMQSLLFGRPELRLFGDTSAQRGLEDQLLGMLDLALGLGATRLVFGSPANRKRGDLAMDDASAIAVAVFRRLGEAAGAAGACFCIEANPVQYGCDFLVDAVESTSFVRAVDSPGVRLHLDAACMALAGDDAAERVRAGADVLAHVHASAPELAAVRAGGPVDHAGFAAALRGVGYPGYVSVEMRATEDAVSAVSSAADLVRSVYG
jgi:sugar phosphate isomerase/epimerase